ncbi:MAG TPA: cold shock domain-containing protein [Acidimicrobiales bacterium]|nr:cold shock domain-containing protein [Acidimicrobiales bacterium]
MPAGSVTEWDDHGGYGTVTADDTADGYFFHCTQLLDGTRTTHVGERVTFDVEAGRLGRWEATNISKISEIDPSESATPER